MAKRAKRKTKSRASAMPDCDCMNETHCVYLTTVEALSLITAATHAVRGGYDDAPTHLESAVNGLLEQCGIDCEFRDDGVMTLTYGAKEGA